MELKGQQAVLHQPVQVEGDRAAGGSGGTGNLIPAYGSGGSRNELKELAGLSITKGGECRHPSRPGKPALVPLPAQTSMYVVGVVVILAGIAVAVRPQFGSLLVAAWLGGIIINLLLLGAFSAAALRHFGLLVGALDLNRLTRRTT